MKTALLSSIATVSILLTGCGKGVEVPPAHVGKVLTKNGYAPETVRPSKFRLPMCFLYCDKLVTLSAGDTGAKEVLKVFMPKDKLNLMVEARFTYSIPTDSKTIDALFDRVPLPNADTTNISSTSIYSIYGQQAVRGILRSEVTRYSISEVLSNRESIGQAIHSAIAKKLKDTKTPLYISRFELADVQPPEVIVKAQEAAKEREIDIQKAEADAQVKIVEAERELEIAKKDRLVSRERAEAIAEQNKIAAKSVTPELLAYRRLETSEAIYRALAASNNTIIVPADASAFSDVTDDAVLAKLLSTEFKKTGGQQAQ